MKIYKKGDKKLLNAWAFYDWANSVYPLVISTAIFPIYFKNITNGETIDFLWFKSIENDAFIGYTSSFTFMILAIISPILSGIADSSGYKKLFMKIFCYMGSISCIMLYNFDMNNFDIGIIYYFLAIIGFWGSLVFYNSYLPDIAHINQQDFISAKGYSLGYVGSTALLILNLLLMEYHDVLNIENKSEAVKISFVSVGIWWLLFSQYSFYYLPGRKFYNIPNKTNLFTRNTLLSGYKQLLYVFNKLKSDKKLNIFLLSFFIFTIPVQTIILLASYFGADLDEISWLDKDTMQSGLILAIIVIQLVAALGAYLSAKISSLYGNINALILFNILWATICIYGYFVTSPNEFYLAAGFIGLAMGGIQSLSRSTFSKFIESKSSTSYFSFYDVSQKLSIVLGTAIYASIDQITGSIRLAILFFALFFIPAILLLLRINKSN